MSGSKFWSFHPDQQSENTSLVLSFLQSRLPLCLPVYRRINFGHFSPAARIISSLPLATLETLTKQPSLQSSSSEPGTQSQEPWLIAFSDPDRGPETQIFIHASWETSLTQSTAKSGSQGRVDATALQDGASDPAQVGLVRSFLQYIKASKTYHPSHQDPELASRIAAAMQLQGADPTTLSSRHEVLLGSIHISTAKTIKSLGVLVPAYEQGPDGMPEAYNKWIFNCKEHDAKDVALPAGLEWGRLRKQDYATVRARTSIPRQDRTLSILPDVAIFSTNGKEGYRPVAWAFLGVDSSLTSLHVEVEYRNIGLGRAMALKAWREHLQVYRGRNTDGEETGSAFWAHADVATDNGPSNGMCRKLGGEVQWIDYWMRIDLEKI